MKCSSAKAARFSNSSRNSFSGGLGPRVARLPEIRDELGAGDRIGELAEGTALLRRHEEAHRALAPGLGEQRLARALVLPVALVGDRDRAFLGRVGLLRLARALQVLPRLIEQRDDLFREHAGVEVGVGRERQEDLELPARLLVAVEHRQRRASIEGEPGAKRRAQSLVLVLFAGRLHLGEGLERAGVVGEPELFLGLVEEPGKVVGSGGQDESGEQRDESGDKNVTTHRSLPDHAGSYAPRDFRLQVSGHQTLNGGDEGPSPRSGPAGRWLAPRRQKGMPLTPALSRRERERGKKRGRPKPPPMRNRSQELRRRS